MAGVTCSILVGAGQRIPGLFRMIEGIILPLGLSMTRVALFPKQFTVWISQRVAIRALARLAFEAGEAMTCSACHFIMGTVQGKIRSFMLV